jgi:outer membrane immunogenic protein
MKTSLFLLAAVPLTLAVPAAAQTTGGAHVDAQLGWDHLPVPDQTGSTGIEPSRNRLIFGVGGGYDINLTPNILVGIDANYDAGSTTGCESSVVVSDDLSCGKMVRDVDVGGRIGVHAGRALVYARAAYDNVLLRSSYTLTPGAAVASNDYGGFRLGAGVELPVMGPVYAKAEYRWTDESSIPNQQQIVTGIGIHF